MVKYWKLLVNANPETSQLILQGKYHLQTECHVSEVELVAGFVQIFCDKFQPHPLSNFMCKLGTKTGKTRWRQVCLDNYGTLGHSDANDYVTPAGEVHAGHTENSSVTVCTPRPYSGRLTLCLKACRPSADTKVLVKCI